MTTHRPRLIDLFDDTFDPPARARGRQDVRAGRVVRLTWNAEMVRATVRDAHEHVVELGACEIGEDRSTLVATCTCPVLRASDSALCRHIRAVLASLSRRPDILDAMRIDALTVVDIRTTRPAEFARTLEMVQRSDVRGAPAPIIESAPDLRAWWAQLGQAGADPGAYSRRRADPWPADHQVIYRVDLDDQSDPGTLLVHFGVRTPMRGGGWGAIRPRNLGRDDSARLPDPSDRQIVSLLHGAATSADPWAHHRPSTQARLTGAVQRTLIELMARSGRCMPAPDGTTTPASDWSPIAWDSGAPWELELALEPQARRSGPQYVLRGWLVRPGDRIPARQVRRATTGGLVFLDHAVGPLRDPGHAAWIETLRERGEPVVMANQVDRLLDLIHRESAPPVLRLPDDLRIERVPGQPVPRIRIFSDGPSAARRHDTGRRPLLAALSFRYGDDLLLPGDTRNGVYQVDPRRYLERDLRAENAARETLFQAGFQSVDSHPDGPLPEAAFTLLPKQLPDALASLLSAQWEVEVEGAPCRRASAIRVRARASGIDWFALEGAADFDGCAVELPVLLRALADGERFIRLGDGTTGMLPEAWIERFGPLADLTHRDDAGQVAFRPAQIGLLDALLERDPEIEFDAQVRQARRRLKSLSMIRPQRAPRGFVGTLRPYQEEGLGWLHFLQALGFGGCLADDMGLGKTVQVLALLAQRRNQRLRDRSTTPPSLIVVPRSLLYNWASEVRRFTPDLRVLAFADADRFDRLDIGTRTPSGRTRKSATAGPTPRVPPCSSDALARAFNPYDVILTTYGTLRIDIPVLCGVRFDYAILDEAQAIKNAGTASAKAARRLQASHRLAMSGTPIENHVGELYSLFDFLNPGMLGRSAARMTDAVSRPVIVNGGTGTGTPASRTAAGDHRNEAFSLLARTIRPFVLRRTKQDVAKDLPEKVEQTIPCELGPRQRRLYDDLRAHYRGTVLAQIRSSGLARSKIMVLEALLRLRQAACHCGLVDRAHMNVPSAKMDVLMPHLAEVAAEGHKSLVFSQFTSLLSIVRARLDAEGVPYAYLDGRTRDRAARVRAFQEDPACRVFLISLKAGGVGLNLTAAEYVFLLDPWWNPAVEAQAIDRAHRIGQTRRVLACRLIASDTIEERVLELQRSKKHLAESIIRADAGLIRSLTVEDLKVLLS
ncbi:MAG: SNF2 helicase associated domain-containing protein [Phycisphaeraceae bacterium]|nr:SNF2 helicase associated domain-containing protein [Phycisphaeraceae bacterium]